MSELVLTVSSSGSAYLWDMRSNAVRATYRPCSSSPNGTSTLPYFSSNSPGYFLSTQSDAPFLHCWSFGKEHVHFKSILAEKLTALVASQTGMCVGAGESGRLYLWNSTSGELLKSFDAHYGKVHTLAFSTLGDYFVSGGEDAGIHVWSLSSLLDEQHNPHASPLKSFQNHRLAVTDLTLSHGSFETMHLYSVSLDRTCRIWHVASGQIMATLPLPQPGTALTIDPAQSFLLVGCEDGHIYQFPLLKRMDNEPKLIFKGHSQKINGLDLSLDGQLLVSASSDHSAIVWDVSSRQMLRRFTQHESPVVCAKIILSPPNLEISDMAKDRMPNVKQFKRNPSSAEAYLPVLPAGRFKRELNIESESNDEEENLMALLETQVLNKCCP